MAQHFGGEEPGGGRRKKAGLVIAAVALVAVVAVAAVALLGGVPTTGQGSDEDPAQGTVAPPASDDDAQAPEAGLPFSLDGVSYDAALTEVGDGISEVELAGAWEFGGDYARIGSFPLDGSTVFGSATENPDDMMSYRAALLGSSGDEYLEEAQSGDAFFEPQDGTGNLDRIVWRSSEFTGLPAVGTDNWRLMTWDRESGETVVLGSAESLNGSSDTPALDGEIVPTANGTHAFFASYQGSGDEWKPVVLAYDLAAAGQEPVVVGEGSYPAATDEGAYWAGSVTEAEAGAVYQALNRWDGTDSETVFSVASQQGTWGITGVWTDGGSVAVCFSSDDATVVSYIGIWSGGFESCERWVHVASQSIVGSMNQDWFVWGSGSQAENAGMYALSLSDGAIVSLGDAPGYSRPSIAQDNNAVLVPISNGSDAVTFRVGVLQE